MQGRKLRLSFFLAQGRLCLFDAAVEGTCTILHFRVVIFSNDGFELVIENFGDYCIFFGVAFEVVCCRNMTKSMNI